MYLLKLSKDKDQYVKMLKRKAGWSFIGPPPFHCLVCEKLHTGTGTHFYPDMVAAFNGRPSDCYPPKWLQDEAGPS
ncbi:hypothetical protein PoB_005263500 [Plakobranchus ocellatus]|uniref:Uncharacterized protein n=1 Tax=Plakobranchus ocellatus TaxID=259542 RepID=A0AAV4C422_9GAST|nr:hypothetical protein PoB_005263500 [Plakobranchus ocellatus]